MNKAANVPGVDQHHSSLRKDEEEAFFKLLLTEYGFHTFELSSMAEGGDTKTFLVRDGRQKAVLRIYIDETKNIQREVDFMSFLAEKNIQVPRLIANRKKRLISEITLHGVHYRYILMKFESGIHPICYTNSLLEDMARTQAMMHVYGIQFYITQSKIKLRSSGLLRFLPHGFSHFDFDASNILVLKDKIKCVLDFEGMRYGALVACLFFTLTRIYEETRDFNDLRLYMATYKHYRPLQLLERTVLVGALVIRYKRMSAVRLFLS